MSWPEGNPITSAPPANNVSAQNNHVKRSGLGRPQQDVQQDSVPHSCICLHSRPCCSGCCAWPDLDLLWPFDPFFPTPRGAGHSSTSVAPDIVSSATQMITEQLSPDTVLRSDSVFVDGSFSLWNENSIYLDQVEEALSWSSLSSRSISGNQCPCVNAQQQLPPTFFEQEFELKSLGPAGWKSSQSSEAYSPSLLMSLYNCTRTPNSVCECVRPNSTTHMRSDPISKLAIDRARLPKCKLRKRRFPCPLNPCQKVFGSRNDLERHLATRKHRRESGSDRVNKFRCTVSWCKRKSEGFMRKDHWARHMGKMHPDLAVGDGEGGDAE
ncbi:uncharacterized protein CC84DRAFT_872467 [Paraphaeosphaeria sporulosa]|uniref:C2H2-type domain-containing protein n=1 Tax=Paraphaeosphaeria sporulosa TaxID=1460663 RepID=A0A177CB29_9PLEO|nr:uncharacterized protein CC84DRAFT_872467 [Paraphaeosphaeria sporulosa]OAG03900.1 hypothetical protein CC84DRAFT_872467 [Paraphaeosphaeria sporulosa]